MAYLTSYEGSNDDFENQGTGATATQSFNVDVAGTTGSVEFYGSRGNASSGTFKFELKTTSPTGTVIATTGTLNSTVLTAYDGNPSWQVLQLVTPVALSLDVDYFLVLTCESGSANDEVRWSVDTTSPGYVRGQSYTGTTAQATRDKNFRIVELVTKKNLLLLGVG